MFKLLLDDNFELALRVLFDFIEEEEDDDDDDEDEADDEDELLLL